MRFGPLGVFFAYFISVAMAEQLPLHSSGHGQDTNRRRNMEKFKLKDGSDIFTPKDMLELPRPGAAIANEEGDLAYMVISQYSFGHRK